MVRYPFPIGGSKSPSYAVFISIIFLRQYRTILMVQMRRQIFRQSKQKFARIVNPLRRIFVTNDGKDASRCAIKA